MTESTYSFLIAETEALEPWEFVAVVPSGRPLHAVELTRREDGTLEVRIPGRPPIVPQLASEVREALGTRTFASEDPSDPTRPWIREVEDAEAAVTLLRSLLAEVFGEKPEARLDIAHGSHRDEHEVQQKLEAVRVRIERVANEIIDSPPEQDADGDYVLPIGDVHVMIAPRAAPGNRVLVRVFAITNVGMNLTPELGLLLSRLNFGLMVGRFSLDAENGSIWFDETLLTDQFTDGDLRWVIDLVAATADQWDDQLKRMFGGATHQEVVTGQRESDAGPAKPGGGTGLYL